MTKEFTRTLVYLGACIASFVVGYFTWTANQPREIDDYALVGKEFYPDFNNPNDATSLEVTVFDEEKATISSFKVEYKDGQWRIPSHHNYPADAEEQLAKTAASIIGITREALASRLEADQARYGVIDPRLEDSAKLKGRGSRITLKNGDKILADYILGKEHKDGGGRYYVRAPEEQVTYLAHFDVDLSTKFQDWIDVDLLKIDRDKLNDITINKYSLVEKVDELGRRFMEKSAGEEIDITREEFGKPWQIEDLDAETEEVNHDAVKELVSALVEIEIIGVRPKPEGLTPALGVTREASQDPAMIANIRGDLASRGYYLMLRGENELSVVAQEGSFYATTDEGIRYELHFGNVFTGDLKEIEIGKSADGEDSSQVESSDESSDPDSQDEQNSDSESSQQNDEEQEQTEEDRQQSRYLFVRVTFDPAGLGPEPTRPEPPEDPGPVDPNAPLRAPRPGEPSLSPLEEFELAEKQYEADLRKYEQEDAAYQKKLEEGRKQAKALSDRLGAWYYVIPAKNVDALRVSRADLVQPKGTDAAKAAEQQGGNSPQLPFTPQPLQLPNQN